MDTILLFQKTSQRFYYFGQNENHFKPQGHCAVSVCAAFSSDRDWKSGISAVKKKILIDEQLEALQKELLKKANAKQGFEELADEIDALREEKQDLLVEEANRAGMK